MAESVAYSTHPDPLIAKAFDVKGSDGSAYGNDWAAGAASEFTAALSLLYRDFSGVRLSQAELRRAKKANWLPINPFTKQTATTYIHGSYSVTYASGATYSLGLPLQALLSYPEVWPAWVPDTGWLIDSEDVSSAELNALMAAAAEVGSQGMDLLTSLAELTDVVKTFRALLDQLIKMLRVLLRRIGERGLSVSEAINWLADNWLLARYGILPTLYELEDALAALESLRLKHGIGKVDIAVDFDRTFRTSFGSAGGEHPHTVTDVCSGSVRGYCLTEFQPPAFRLDPWSTAWELTPLSFVIDWVLGVGTALSAFYAIDGLGKSQLAVGHNFTITRTIAPCGSGVPSFYSHPVFGGIVDYSAPHHVATVVTLRSRKPASMPSVIWANTPQWSAGSALKRPLDFLALLRSELRFLHT